MDRIRWGFAPTIGTVSQVTTMQVPRNQHVVSRVVLKAFAPRGLIVRRDLRLGQEKPKSTKVVARQRDFVRPEFARSIEGRWSKTETRVPEATKAVLNGTMFDRPDLVNVLYETIALHLVRSTAYQNVHQATVRVLLEENRAALHRTAPDFLDQWYHARCGLISTGREARDLLLDDLFSSFTEASESGELFAERLEEFYDSILPLLKGKGLEIGIAPAGHEFLIGDIPALTLD